MCTSPLKGWKNDDGSIFQVTNSNVVGIRFFKTGDFKRIYDKSLLLPGDYTEFIDIPCRSCAECHAQTRREWVTRAVCESMLHDTMLFCTFTYDDDKIPKTNIVDSNGEILTHATLDYTDFQKFMKKLRKKVNAKQLRYMVCGEYGSHTFRPHYHAIIYGLSFDDFKSPPEFYKNNSSGDALYIIPDLTETWSHGYVIVSQANTQTMCYVAGYVAKKLTDSDVKRFYDESGIVRPFIKSSLGLGREYFDQIIDKFDNIYDYVPIATADESFKIFLTSNWKMKYEDRKVYPELSEKLGIEVSRDSDIMNKDKSSYYQNKVDRRITFNDNKFSLYRTDMSPEDYNSSRNIDLRNSCQRKRGVY